MKKKHSFVFEPLELRTLMASDLGVTLTELPQSCIAFDLATEQPRPAELVVEGEGPGVSKNFATESSSLHVVFVDGLGKKVEELVSGREYWMQVRTKDIRAVPAGVFAAYVDIGIASRSLEITGTPTGVGAYKNGTNGLQVGVDQLKSFGGFSNSIEPTGPEATLAAVRVKAGAPGPLSLDVKLSEAQGTEFLLYGVNEELDPANVELSIPQFTIVSERESTTPYVPIGDLPPDLSTIPEAKEVLLKLQLSVVDTNGQTVNVIKPNQEYTLQLKGTDLRRNPIGVFSGFVDISFDPDTIIVDDIPVGAKDFVVPKNYFKVSEGKVMNFGALSQLVVYPYQSESVIATLRFRAGASGNANLDVKLTEGGIGTSMYGYGELDSVQVEVEAPIVTVANSYDANGDGFVSPIDALLLIDYLVHRFDSVNTESTRAQSLTSKFDMSNDGVVSAIDVLLVIDYLQLKVGLVSPGVPRGEGESPSSPSTEDADSLIAMLASDQISQELSLKRSRRV